MNLAKALVKGSLFRTSHTLITMIVSFIMMPVLIEGLGDHWYGIWAIVGGFIGVYYTFDLGVTSAVSRYISRYLGKDQSDNVNAVINTSIVIFSVLGAGIFILSLVISIFSDNFVDSVDDSRLISTLIIITGLSVALEFPFNSFAGIAEAKARYDLIALSRIIILLTSSAFTYYFVISGYGVLSVAIISFCSARLSNLVYLLIALKQFPKIKFGSRYIKRSTFKELFSFSLWSFAVELTGNLPYRTNPIIIGYFLSASSVTVYVVGQRLVEYSTKFLYQATNMMTPVFSRYHATGDYEGIREKTVLVTRINAFLGCLAISGLIIFSMPFIDRWVGHGYGEAVNVVFVRVFGTIGIFVFSQVNSVLYAMNRHSIIAKVTLIEGMSLVVLSIILVQYYGIVGIALASTIPGLLFRGIVLPALCTKMIELPYLRLVKEVLPVMVFTVVFATLYDYVLYNYFTVRTFGEILSHSIIYAVIFLLSVAFLFLKDYEWTLLEGVAPVIKKVRNRRNV
ncbi:polysaccharide biosynthesis protein [Marinobacter salinexigens]|uniref:Polysaccharide biosynthesis protein n=1 Tax=Marinobacter salinexigens TaxID=2919747 RepID=A0A5B0VKG3_9GAMM|nr:oligosaccharide flippase family protein [Marinobacter salinexigens]KAA1175056.1 polysaccharide biosynthesis protein [Marinobacter salinexigens]